jgi:hypothetical protein
MDFSFLIDLLDVLIKLIELIIHITVHQFLEHMLFVGRLGITSGHGALFFAEMHFRVSILIDTRHSFLAIRSNVKQLLGENLRPQKFSGRNHLTSVQLLYRILNYNVGRPWQLKIELLAFRKNFGA